MHSIFENQTAVDVKDFAERLRTRLQAKHGFTLGQGKTLHLLAETNGFDAWVALEKLLGSTPSAQTTSPPRGIKAISLSLEEESRRRKRLDKYLEDVDALMKRRLRADGSRNLKEWEQTGRTIETPYGDVDETELLNLQELFDELSSAVRLSHQILKSCQRVSEKSPSFRNSEIVGDLIELAGQLNTVLYFDAPSVLPNKEQQSVGEFATKVHHDILELMVIADDFDRLTNHDHDDDVSDLLDNLDFAMRLEPEALDAGH